MTAVASTAGAVGGWTGRRALVCGLEDPVGVAIARSLLDAGATVAIGDRDELVTRSRVRDLTGVHRVTMDLRDADAVAQGVQDAHSTLGEIDVLVNCAGPYEAPGPWWGDELACFDEVISHHVRPVFLTLKNVIPLMQPGSAIVNVLATSRRWDAPAACDAARGAVITMSRGLAWEIAPDMRVNVVNPLSAGLDELGEGGVGVPGAPLWRDIQPRDVAGAVRFLTGPESAFLTGVVLSVDGGLRAL